MTLITPDAAFPRETTPALGAVFAPTMSPPRLGPADSRGARAFLRDLADAAARAADGGVVRSLALAALPGRARRAVDAALGLGEVVCGLESAAPLSARETALPGLWLVAQDDVETLEPAPAPRAWVAQAHEPLRPARWRDAAPEAAETAAFVAGLARRAAAWRAGDPPESVTPGPVLRAPAAAEALAAAHGRGAGHAAARGRGLRRIEATAIPRLWRVRCMNPQHVLIHEAFEIADIPSGVAASRADLARSAAELRAMLDGSI